MFSFIQELDESIIHFIWDNLHTGILDRFFEFITALGNHSILWYVIALVFLAQKKYRHIGLLVLIGVVSSELLCNLALKNIFQRPRPCADFPDIILTISRPKSYSFPSGHTTTAFTIAFILAYFFKKYRVLIYFLAALIGFSRIYLFVHYPSDILAGIVIGISCGLGVIYGYRKIKENRDHKIEDYVEAS